MQSSFACRHSAYRIGLVGWRRRQTFAGRTLRVSMICPPAWSTTARTAGRQCRPRPDRSQAAIPFQPRLIPDKGSGRGRPPAADMIALPLVGRKPAHRQALLERHRPRVDQRRAPRDGLGIDVGDLELPARRQRPTRPRGPHSPSARESSLPAGPAPRPQNPQPMSELRNHARKLTPDSATLTRTGQHTAPRSRRSGSW